MTVPMTDKEYVAAAGLKCPSCGLKDENVVEAGHPEIDARVVLVPVRCARCEAEWVDVYELVGYSNLEVEAELG